MTTALVFSPLKIPDKVNRKINLRNLKIRDNIILVSTNKGRNTDQYLGSFKISRVIFDVNKTRAFIYNMDVTKPEETIHTINEFEKKDNSWFLK